MQVKEVQMIGKSHDEVALIEGRWRRVLSVHPNIKHRAMVDVHFTSGSISLPYATKCKVRKPQPRIAKGQYFAMLVR